MRARFTSPMFVVGAFVFVVIVAMVIAAPLLATHDPLHVPVGGARLSPSADHWFGTDQQGRDVFARVLYGGRVSLVVGFGSALLAAVIGTLVGAIAGVRRRWTDQLLMRTTDVFFVFPTILFAACLVLVFGRNTWAMMLAVALTTWPQVARVVRSVTLEAAQSLFVQASRSNGLGERAIFRLHLLPRIVSMLLPIVIASVATGILTEASLSFLAIGVAEPKPSWGLMIASGRRFLTVSPHIILFPAAAIVLTVGSLVLMHESITRGDTSSDD
jgi:peptide/nickel transport system permease protein